MLGVGQPVRENPIPFLDLDYNLRGKGNRDSQGRLCNIFVFDLAAFRGDIIKFLDRQLTNDPNNPTTFPSWVEDRFPEWVEKYQQISRER